MIHGRKAGRERSAERRKGFAYVVVLILTAVLASAALAFINRVGVTNASTSENFDRMKAEYYARAAANHAMWGLINSGFFPFTEDRYYMKDFDDGRYGYMVTRHTATTFATVAVIGICNESVVQASYVMFIPPGGWDPYGW